MDRSPYFRAARATFSAVSRASSGGISSLALILPSISLSMSSIRVCSRMTPPSRVLKGLPSLPFMVPKPMWCRRVSGRIRPVFRAQRKTWLKCSSCRLSVM